MLNDRRGDWGWVSLCSPNSVWYDDCLFVCLFVYACSRDSGFLMLLLFSRDQVVLLCKSFHLFKGYRIAKVQCYHCQCFASNQSRCPPIYTCMLPFSKWFTIPADSSWRNFNLIDWLIDRSMDDYQEGLLSNKTVCVSLANQYRVRAVINNILWEIAMQIYNCDTVSVVVFTIEEERGSVSTCVEVKTNNYEL